MAKLVLLIDDDREDAEIFAAALTESGIGTSLDYYEDGTAAMERLMGSITEVPDIIFLDINMPSINGWECLREIKKLAGLQSIPIVMYSTFNLQQEGINAKDVGAAAFFTKPDNFRELKDKLTHLFHDLFNTAPSD
ncbi:MAG: response regulator [Chitinophaga rupis]